MYDTLSYTIHRDGGFDCRNTVQEAFIELDRLVVAGEATQIQELLGLCTLPVTTDAHDISTIFDTYLRYIIDYIEAYHFEGVNEMCDGLRTPADQPLAALGRWAHFRYGQSGECRDLSYASLVQRASNTSWDGPGRIRK